MSCVDPVSVRKPRTINRLPSNTSVWKMGVELAMGEVLMAMYYLDFYIGELKVEITNW